MWFSRANDGLRGWFAITGNDGHLVTDIPSSSFVTTVRDPNDITGSTFPVTQSGKPGLYYFTVSAEFLTAVGIGDYGVIVEVSSSSPLVIDAFSVPMKITDECFDTLSGSIWNTSSSFSSPGTMGALQNNLDVTVSSRLADGDVSLTSASIDSITNSVWDEPIGEHLLSSGSAGATIYSGSVTNISASVSIDNAAIADAVWNESLFEHQTSGSAGWVLERMMNVSSSVDFIHSVNAGRWRIDTGSNELVMYKSDNSTEVARFTLHDADGNPTTTNPFERRRS